MLSDQEIYRLLVDRFQATDPYPRSCPGPQAVACIVGRHVYMCMRYGGATFEIDYNPTNKSVVVEFLNKHNYIQHELDRSTKETGIEHDI